MTILKEFTDRISESFRQLGLGEIDFEEHEETLCRVWQEFLDSGEGFPDRCMVLSQAMFAWHRREDKWRDWAEAFLQWCEEVREKHEIEPRTD